MLPSERCRELPDSTAAIVRGGACCERLLRSTQRSHKVDAFAHLDGEFPSRATCRIVLPAVQHFFSGGEGRPVRLSLPAFSSREIPPPECASGLVPGARRKEVSEVSVPNPVVNMPTADHTLMFLSRGRASCICSWIIAEYRVCYVVRRHPLAPYSGAKWAPPGITLEDFISDMTNRGWAVDA